jgi:8-oxo-dGTP diphosphatase
MTSKHTASGGPSFVVMRQDDNGNEIELARTLTRAEAETIARDFEARAHKQIYWVIELDA